MIFFLQRIKMRKKNIFRCFFSPSGGGRGEGGGSRVSEYSLQRIQI